MRLLWERPGFLVLLASLASSAAAYDAVLVDCPPSLRPAMREWVAFRQSEGVRVAWADRVVRDASGRPSTGTALLIVGDGRRCGLRPAKVPARVVARYGPERSIASDHPLAAARGFGVVARLPFCEPRALRAYLARVVRRERRDAGWDDARLRIAVGAGGFSPLIDAAIEGAASRLVRDLSPEEWLLTVDRYGPSGTRSTPSHEGRRGGVWVWMGHGLRDAIPGPSNERLVEATGGADLAVLLACYTGDFAHEGVCVAERLIHDANGPLAVIAATRVSMPYGNARLGGELLAATRARELGCAGMLFARARQRSLLDTVDPRFAGLDSLAGLLGADPALLAEERSEHATMYHLLGDPLLRVRRTKPLALRAARQDASLAVEGVAITAGRLEVRVASSKRGSIDQPVASRQVSAGEAFAVPIPVGVEPGRRTVRVAVRGRSSFALGAIQLRESRRLAGSRVAIGPTGATSR